MSPDMLANKMEFARPAVKAIQAMLSTLELSPLEAAMGYVRQAWPDSAILFGAETSAQVSDNLKAFYKQISQDLISEAQRRFPHVPEKILNPSLWGV